MTTAYFLLRRSWYFGRLRPVRCWARLGHTWKRYEWTDKHGGPVVEEQCGRCLIDRHSFALWFFWGGIPAVWRISYRVKHGKWRTSTTSDRLAVATESASKSEAP